MSRTATVNHSLSFEYQQTLLGKKKETNNLGLQGVIKQIATFTIAGGNFSPEQKKACAQLVNRVRAFHEKVMENPNSPDNFPRVPTQKLSDNHLYKTLVAILKFRRENPAISLKNLTTSTQET